MDFGTEGDPPYYPVSTCQGEEPLAPSQSQSAMGHHPHRCITLFRKAIKIYRAGSDDLTATTCSAGSCLLPTFRRPRSSRARTLHRPANQGCSVLSRPDPAACYPEMKSLEALSVIRHRTIESSMSTPWLRIGYTCEFLLAVIAVFTAWSQVGGQGHLDLMPWYAKLVLACGVSAAIVGLTAAMAREERIANRRTAYWFLLIVLLAIVMGAVTFYFHLHEAVDDSDEEGTTASVRIFTES